MRDRRLEEQEREVREGKWADRLWIWTWEQVRVFLRLRWEGEGNTSSHDSKVSSKDSSLTFRKADFSLGSSGISRFPNRVPLNREMSEGHRNEEQDIESTHT
jgi:hypothetical protein